MKRTHFVQCSLRDFGNARGSVVADKGLKGGLKKIDCQRSHSFEYYRALGGSGKFYRHTTPSPGTINNVQQVSGSLYGIGALLEIKDTVFSSYGDLDWQITFSCLFAFSANGQRKNPDSRKK